MQLNYLSSVNNLDKQVICWSHRNVPHSLMLRVAGREAGGARRARNTLAAGGGRQCELTFIGARSH